MKIAAKNRTTRWYDRAVLGPDADPVEFDCGVAEVDAKVGKKMLSAHPEAFSEFKRSVSADARELAARCGVRLPDVPGGGSIGVADVRKLHEKLEAERAAAIAAQRGEPAPETAPEPLEDEDGEDGEPEDEGEE